jgi:hypothetical protein
MATTDNKLDIVQGVPLLPWEWANLGAVFGSAADNSQCVAARANFVLRKGGGLDGALERAGGRSSGSVLEGLGDVGFNLRAQQYAFHISASNLAYKQGVRVGVGLRVAPRRGSMRVQRACASIVGEAAADGEHSTLRVRPQTPLLRRAPTLLASDRRHGRAAACAVCRGQRAGEPEAGVRTGGGGRQVRGAACACRSARVFGHVRVHTAAATAAAASSP